MDGKGAESVILGQLKLNLFIDLTKIPEREGSISRSSHYSSGIKGNEEGRRVQDFFYYLKSLRASPQVYREWGGVI